MDIDRGSTSPELPGITVHHFHPDPGNDPDLLSLTMQAAVYIVKLLLRLQPGILHSHYMTFHGWAAALASYPCTVATVWGSDLLLEARRDEYIRRMTGFALRAAALTTADSPDLVDEVVELNKCPDRVEFVLFGIDTDLFRPELDVSDFAGRIIGRRYRGGDKTPVIMSPRQFKPEANVHVIIEAIPRVLAAWPDALFILKSYLTRGTHFDDYENTLRVRVKELGIEQNVLFVSDMPYESMPYLYNISDITLSLRDTDGAACSVWESMSCGTPVITGKIPSMVDFIEDGRNGFLIDHQDSGQLASVIIRLLHDRNALLSVGDQARRTSVEKADYRKHWDYLDTCYRTLVNHWLTRSQQPSHGDLFCKGLHDLWKLKPMMARKAFEARLRSDKLTIYQGLQALAALGTAAVMMKDEKQALREYTNYIKVMSMDALDAPIGKPLR